VLYLTALLYIPVIVMIWLLPPQPPTAGSRDRSVLQSVADGLRHVWNDRTLRWVVLVIAGTSFFARPYLNLLPAFVATQLRLGSVFHLSPVFIVCGTITVVIIAIALSRAHSLRDLRATGRSAPPSPAPEAIVGESVSG